MNVCSLGGVVFSVSEKTVKTIKNLSWKTSASYAAHKLHGRKGIIEYTGTEPDEIEFEADFSAFLGVNPLKMLNRLRKLVTDHNVVQLIVGTDTIGGNWVVTNVDASSDSFYMDGTMLAISAKIKIKEYPEE